MPGGNRTGPLGQGPLTGKGMGYCAGSATPGFMSLGSGFGFRRGFGFRSGIGRGFGFGRGRGWMQAGFGRFGGYPYPQDYPNVPMQPLDEEQEMNFLNNQAEMLEDELKQINKRRAALKGNKKETK